MSQMPEKFENVTAVCKANVYFDGKVVSHTVLFADGTKKTLGLIYPGEFTFNTEAPERMEVIAGSCRVKLAGQDEWNTYEAGTFFDVPGNSAFDIGVEDGIMEYVCSFL
jgi:purine/pyrimidine-nucleoside phosphorylase